MKRRLLVSAVGAAAWGPLALRAQPVELSGVRFEPQLPLAGKTLLLNGAAIRFKAIVKVYAVGLYLPAKASSLKAVLEMAGPKRVQVTMLRDISGSELGRSFTRNFEENASREEIVASISQIAKMGEVFSARKQLKLGESFTLDWIPGTGTLLSINGEAVAEPFAGTAFFHGMLKLWIGDGDTAGVRDALLGVPPKRRTRE